MKYFLLVFDRREGRLLNETDFQDSKQALAARFAAERLHRGMPDVEVVVLGAESRDVLRQTHARYFQDLPSLNRRGGEFLKAATAAARKAG